mgnify:CR=1 FL=1
MSVTPQIRINAVVPRPDGAEVDSQFALGAAAIPLSLADTVGITSFVWELTSAPYGATTAIANTTPTTPFATTIGPLDAYGTYILKGVANGDAASVKEVAITVLALSGDRIPARSESNQWNSSWWWWHAMRDAFLGLSKRRIGYGAIDMPADANYAVPAGTASLNKRCIKVTSAVVLTVTRDVSLASFSTGLEDPWFLVHNDTAGGQNIVFKGPAGAGVTIASGATKVVYTDGTNFNGT